MLFCRPDVLQGGESDLTTVGQLMRYVSLSNFTGHPAIAIPVGHDHQGMQQLHRQRFAIASCLTLRVA